jgi:hypothetical protein
VIWIQSSLRAPFRHRCPFNISRSSLVRPGFTRWLSTLMEGGRVHSEAGTFCDSEE